MDNLKRLKKVSKKFLFCKNNSNIEEFCKGIYDDIFCNGLGYDHSASFSRTGCDGMLINEKLIIKLTFDDINEKRAEQLLFKEYRKENKNNSVEWGIIVNPKGIRLLNDTVYTDGISAFRSEKTVLQILHGINTDQNYLDFFSYENILGNKPNTYYFKDILQYKNRNYKGSEKSWPAYSSTLKRFFSFISGDVGYDNNDNSNVYNEIELKDFYRYIEEKTKLKKENTLKNVFFYLKDFMDYNSDRGTFHIGTQEMLDGFSRTLKKDGRQDVIDKEKLKRAIQYLNTGKNAERDVAMFLMELSFGLERRKLRLLKWKENVRFDRNNNIEEDLIIDGKKKQMPKKLITALKKLKELRIEGEYVFYRTKENGREPIRDDVINEVFNKIAKKDPYDEFYKALTPANIRGSLVRYLLKKGEALEKIINMMNLEIHNLGNYISLKDIENIMEERTANDPELMSHPMDSFLEELL